ncbi:MAG: ABC transporter permease [Thermoanaerobaculia bacterium]|nr:ABC transporter permease [Thermoanaerobaculia bacterium]
MEIRPILSAMMRQKVRAILIAGQIALTVAVTANALFLVKQRVDLMSRDHGFDAPNLIYVSYTDLRSGVDYFDAVDADLRLLRGLPGVVGATPVGAPPAGSGGNGECFTTQDGDLGTEVCHNRNKVDEEGLATLGLRLVAGRDFTREDVTFEGRDDRGYASRAIVTQALADSFFPDGDAVGQVVYSDGVAVTIIGIVEHMLGPWIHDDSVARVMLQPTVRQVDHPRFMVRAAPGERDRLVAEIEEAMLAATPERLVRIRTQAELLERVYRGDRAMVKMLLLVVCLMILVTSVGIVGLASSSVSQRTKQIGTRRALGARRRDILRYFLIESGLVTSAGILLGALGAIALNQWMVQTFSLERLDLRWLLLAAASIMALSLLATLPPARRATRVSPSVATRTV